mmetsp:Transcript_37556/g.70013  ORF Transcript_37556/g.70013 Transcript_37556/m.70013 type:complete len:142 (+) Transcript_37556:59-484(+)
MPLDPALKQLQIKVGAVKRTKKEYEAYVKEEGAQRSKIDGMRSAGQDEADIKKQMEVLNDTLTVIPDTRHRLQKYATELRDYLAESHQDVSTTGEGDSDEVQTILEARQVLREVDQSLGTQTAEEPEDSAGTGGTADVGDF